MSIIIYNLTDKPADIVNKIEASDEVDIILYHDNTNNDISSLEQPAVCELLAMVFRLISVLPEYVFIKLHAKTKEELFICEYANRVYNKMDVDVNVMNSMGNIKFNNTDESILDVIRRCMK